MVGQSVRRDGNGERRVDRDHIRGGRAGRGRGRVWRGSGEQVRGVRYRGRRCRAKDGAHYADLSAMHLAAHETGVSFEQVTTGLVRFERSVFAAQAATSKQAQMLARMRFSTDQVKGAMQNLDPFLDLFVGKFAHLHEGPEKVGVAGEFQTATKKLEAQCGRASR